MKHRILPSVGDDGNGKFGFVAVYNREAGSVHRDEPFFDDVAHDVRRGAERDVSGLALRGNRNDLAGAVHVSLNDVASKASVGGHRAFEIDRRSGGQGAEVGPAQRLRHGVDAERLAVHGGYGEARAVDADAVGDGEVVHDSGRGNDEAGAGGLGYRADFFDYAGEHSVSPLPFWIGWVMLAEIGGKGKRVFWRAA